MSSTVSSAAVPNFTNNLWVLWVYHLARTSIISKVLAFTKALPNRFWVPVRVRDLSKVGCRHTQPTRYDRRRLRISRDLKYCGFTSVGMLDSNEVAKVTL
jgi:hypothetical protein